MISFCILSESHLISFLIFLECRQLISTIKNSNVFQLFLKDLIIEFNNTNESKINRSLQLDVKSRWNSTHYMLEAFVIFRPIIDSLFKNIRKMNLSKKQTNSLLKLEISNTCWDVVEQLLKVLEPFRNAIEHISGTQYPTVGLTLFVFRKIQHHFLELSRPDDTELLKNMKEVLHDKLIHYINIYNEGFKTLMVSAPFIVNNQLISEKFHLIFFFYVNENCKIFNIYQKLIIKQIDDIYNIHFL